MKRELRVQAAKAKTAVLPLSKPMVLSAEAFRRAFEAEERCSERRFERLGETDAASTIAAAAVAEFHAIGRSNRGCVGILVPMHAIEPLANKSR